MIQDTRRIGEGDSLTEVGHGVEIDVGEQRFGNVDADLNVAESSVRGQLHDELANGRRAIRRVHGCVYRHHELRLRPSVAGSIL